MRTENKSQRGFSLVELMIVISIIGILVAIGIPAWQASVRSTNEAAAITHLGRISTAQVTFFNTKNRTTYGTFEQLSSGGYLGKQFAGETPLVDGYIYRMTLTAKSGNQPAAFSVNADPQKPTGLRRPAAATSTSAPTLATPPPTARSPRARTTRPQAA